MFAEPVVLRGLVAAAAAAAVVGSVVMRRWDQAAGKRVAELGRARASDEWRYEERIAEAEADLEESRELRGKLETKLRAKRAELAALRNEHAALLRRYATAETERASALEGRRLLAIEATSPTSPTPALPAAGAAAGSAAGVDNGSASGAGSSAEDLVPAVRAGAPVPTSRTETPAPRTEASAPRTEAPAVTPTPSLFQLANAALDRMTPRAAPRAEPEATPGAAPETEEESRGKPGAADGYAGHERAVAVAPPVQARRQVPQGDFDFFGTKSVAPAALESVQNEDLADVVGEEALAVHKAESEGEFKDAPEGDAARGVGQVIDLTAHDETEQIDVAELRTALRA